MNTTHSPHKKPIKKSLHIKKKKQKTKMSFSTLSLTLMSQLFITIKILNCNCSVELQKKIELMWSQLESQSYCRDSKILYVAAIVVAGCNLKPLSQLAMHMCVLWLQGLQTNLNSILGLNCEDNHRGMLVIL